MVRNKIYVRAQRKFAHKAFILNMKALSDGKSDPVPIAANKRLEQDNSATSPPVTVKEPLCVYRILNQASFRNMHSHKKPPDEIKDLRIVLKRLSPVREIAAPVNSGGGGGDQLSPQTTDKTAERRRCLTPLPATSATQRKKLSVIKHNRMCLRTHSSTKLNIKEMKDKAFKLQSLGTPLSSRRQSETSNEDNRPLTYFMKKTIVAKKKKRAEKRNVITRSLRPIKHISLIDNIRSSAATKKSLNTHKILRKSRPIKLPAKVDKGVVTIPQKAKRLTRSRASEVNNNKKRRFELSRTESSTGIETTTPVKENMSKKTEVTASKEASKSLMPDNIETLQKASKCPTPDNVETPVTRNLVPKRNKRVPSPKTRDIALELNTCVPLSANALTPLPTKDPQTANYLASAKDPNYNTANSFIEFFINVYNGDTNNYAGPEHSTVNSDDDSSSIFGIHLETAVQERVEQWLGTSTPEENITPAKTQSTKKIRAKNVKCQKKVNSIPIKKNTPNQYEFKIPEMPRRRIVRAAPSIASTAAPTPISYKEKELRRICTAWDFNRLSCLDTNPEWIELFCAECLRCKIMFKTPPMVSLEYGPGDVYDFDSEQDGRSVINITPYSNKRSKYDKGMTNNSRDKLKSTLLQISKLDHHMEKLNIILTTKGKKVLRTTSIIKDNMGCIALLPKDQNMLGQVIGMLIETNANGVDSIQVPKQHQTQPSAGDNNTAKNTPDLNGVSHQTRRNEHKPADIGTDTVILKKRGQKSPQKPIKKTDQEPIPSTSAVNDKKQDAGGIAKTVSQIKKTVQSGYTMPTRSSIAVVSGAAKFNNSLLIMPSVHEFAEGPLKLAASVSQKNSGIGLCGIKPPNEFKPICDIDNEETSFKMNNQYVHRMLQRWGSATKELTLIRSNQNPKYQASPLFDGLEVDLVQLYHCVQEENGVELQDDMRMWSRIMEKLGLQSTTKPTKLQKIYYKYLLDYKILSFEQRQKLITAVGTCWAKREAQAVARAKDPLWRQRQMRSGEPLEDDEVPSRVEMACSEAEECVAPGRNSNIRSFKKIASAVQSIYFPKCANPTPEEVEVEYWSLVMSATSHVCVHSASVDTNTHDCGFTADRSTPYGNHPWNLKHLSKSSANLLSYLGPMPGVSSPTLHFGMTFTTSCWHMDPTCVTYVEYLHSGPPKIWYSISEDQADAFRAAAESLCPFAVQNKDIWLPCDIMMIPPNLLREQGVVVSRHVQHAGEYVIVYPKTYCACIDTGYTVSEGVYFAPYSWLNNAESIYLNLRNNCEPSLFPMAKLLIAMSQDPSTPWSHLHRVNTMMQSMLHAELSYRQTLASRSIELLTPEVFQEQNKKGSRTAWQLHENGECAYCRCHLFLSRVIGLTKGQTGLCALHGVDLFEQSVQRGQQLTGVYCIVLLSNTQITNILKHLQQRMRGIAGAKPHAELNYFVYYHGCLNNEMPYVKEG